MGQSKRGNFDVAFLYMLNDCLKKNTTIFLFKFLLTHTAMKNIWKF